MRATNPHTCPNCGRLIEGPVAFCPYCGAASDPALSATLTPSPVGDRALGAGIMAACWGVSAVICIRAFGDPPHPDPTNLSAAIFLISLVSLPLGALVWGGTWLAVQNRYPNLFRGYKIALYCNLVLMLGGFAVCTAPIPRGKL